MKRKLIISLGLTLVISLVLALVAFANPGNIMVVSNEDTIVYYAGYDPLPAGWSQPGFDDSGWPTAVDFPFSGYLNPEYTQPFPGSGARWISLVGQPEQLPDYYDLCAINGELNYATYLFRREFSVPGSAYNFSGIVAVAADNFGWLFLNGDLVLNPTDLINGLNFLPGYQTVDMIQPANLSCENVLSGKVENGAWVPGAPPEAAHGPMGLLFMLYLNYETPNVVWQPPITNYAFELKDGTTLPLIFKFYTQDGGLVTSLKEVFLAVYGPSDGGWGPEVARWDLGSGTDSLRFDPYESNYIGNFHTKEFALEDGKTYTVVVHDGCTGEPLGEITFAVFTQSGTGRGNR